MPKPRDGYRPIAPRGGPQAETPLAHAADRCIAAYEAVIDLNDPDLRRLSELLLIAIGKRLAREDRRVLRQTLN